MRGIYGRWLKNPDVDWELHTHKGLDACLVASEVKKTWFLFN
jgi:hypothetical protein